MNAHAAVTIINATATGRGCSLAINGGAQATWEWSNEFSIDGAPDDRLARACVEVARGALGKQQEAKISIQATFPPARGLKTSSSAAAAMLGAAGVPNLEENCVKAARLAGVTVTGAFDDQVAVVRGGCHLTDNATMQIIQTFEVPCEYVAVWVPEASIDKSVIKNLDASVIAPKIEAAEASLRQGNVAAALTQNGKAFHQFYAAAGLPITDEPTKVALAAGALGAGLSGTGPAVAALFDAPVELAPVAGGSWQFHRTVTT